MRRYLIAIVLILILGAVLALRFVPERQLRTELQNAGLSPEVADCAAGRMVHELRYDQLWKLRDLRLARDAANRAELQRRLRALDDPEITRIATRALLGCTLENATIGL